MQRIFNRYWKKTLFAVVDAGLGFAYWRFVGCTSGTCPLTSQWHTSMLFGGIIGLLAAPPAGKAVTKTEPGSAENPE